MIVRATSRPATLRSLYAASAQPADGVGDAADAFIVRLRQQVAVPTLHELGERELEQWQCTRCRLDVTSDAVHQPGFPPEPHGVRRDGNHRSKLLGIWWQHGDQGSGDDAGETCVAERAVEEVGAQGGDDPDVAVGVVENTEQQVDESLPCLVAVDERVQLLELVDHEHDGTAARRQRLVYRRRRIGAGCDDRVPPTAGAGDRVWHRATGAAPRARAMTSRSRTCRSR